MAHVPRRAPKTMRSVSTSECYKVTVDHGNDNVQSTSEANTQMPRCSTFPGMGDSDTPRDLAFGSDILEAMCTQCERKNQSRPSKAYCVQCKLYVCTRCFRHHKDHATLTGNMMPGIITVKADPKSESETCTEHGQTIEQTCADHNCLCCAECIRVHHGGCRLQSLVGISETDTEGLKRTVLQLTREQMKAFIETRSAWTVKKEDILKEKQAQIKEVKVLCKDVVDAIQTLERECISEISQASATEIKTVEKKLNEYNKYIKEISKDIRLTGEPRQESKDTKIINLKAVHHRALTTYQPLLDKSVDPGFDYKVKFRISLFTLDSVQKTKAYHTVVCGDTPDSNHVSDATEKESVNKHPKHSVRILEDEPVSETTCITGIISLGDDKILVTDEGNRRLKLFDTQFNIIHYVRLTSAPRGLSAKHTCAITLPKEKSVQLFNIETDTILKRGKLHVGFECTDVVCLSDGMILCCFNRNDSTLIRIDYAGKLLNTFNFSQSVGKCPNYMCASTDGSALYLSDVVGGVFKLDINEIMKVVWQYRKPDLKCPLGIAVDDRDRVYTVYFSSGIMHRLHPDGSSDDSSVGGATTNLGYTKPQCVCFLPVTREFLVAFDGTYDVLRYSL